MIRQDGARKAAMTARFKHDRQLAACRFSPCGRFVVAGGVDEKLHRWELEGGKKISFEGHASWIAALAVRADGRLFSLDWRGTLCAWEIAAEEPRPLWTVERTHGAAARALAASPDGARLATAGADGVVRLWSAEDGKAVKELAGPPADLFSIAFHPDGKSLASGDQVGVVRHWDLASGRVARELDACVLHARKEDFIADAGGVRALAFDAEGRRLAAGGVRDAKSNTFIEGKAAGVLFDWESGKAGTTLGVNGEEGMLRAFRFLADGTLAGYFSGKVHGPGGAAFWKPGEPEPFHVVRSDSGYDLDLHPDGARLAAAVFEVRGHTGNGRRAKGREEYVPNAGGVVVIDLRGKPAK